MFEKALNRLFADAGMQARVEGVCSPFSNSYDEYMPTIAFLYQYMLTTEQLLQTYAYYYTGYAFYCTFPELLPIYATYSTLCVLLPILSFTLQYRRIAIPRSIGAVRPLSGTIVD